MKYQEAITRNMAIKYRKDRARKINHDHEISNSYNHEISALDIKPKKLYMPEIFNSYSNDISNSSLDDRMVAGQPNILSVNI